MTGSYDVIFNFLVIIRSETMQIPVFGQIEYKTFSKYSKLLSYTTTTKKRDLNLNTHPHLLLF